MTRGTLRTLAAAAGLATAIRHLQLAPGAGADGLLRSLEATWLAPEFLPALAVAVVVCAAGGAALARAGVPALAGRLATALSLLLVVPLLEPLFFRCPLWAVLAVVCCVCLPAAPAAARAWRPSAVRAATLVGALGLLLVAGWPAVQGDEPHYLLVAHSLVRDGDLDVADEYGDAEYRPFHPSPLSPHYRPGLLEGSRYSMHGVGYGAALAPAYAVGLGWSRASAVPLARALQVIVFAWFAATLWRLCAPLAGASASTAAVLLACALAPLLFAPLHLFPETLAMALSCAAFLRLSSKPRPAGVAIAGLQLALLPWLGVKYLPLSLAVLVGGVLAGDRGRAALRRLPAAVVPLAVSLLAHGLFTQTIYGSWSPSSVYIGADPSFTRQPGYGADWLAYLADWPGALRTFVGYFLDQREGLLAVGPQFLLAAAGLPLLWRRSRRLTLALALILFAHLGPYAVSQQLGGHSPPARPVMAVAWVLVPALALAWAAAGGWLLPRAQGALAAAGTALTVAFVLDPALLPHDYGITRSWLLQRLAPAGIELWRAFPSWVNLKEGAHWPVTLGWLAATVLLALLLGRESVGSGAADSGGRGRRQGAVAGLLAIAAICAWAASLVVTARHVGTTLVDGGQAFVDAAVPEQAWAEPGGVWVAPGGRRDIVLVSASSPGTARLSVRTLVDSNVRVGLRGGWIDLPMRGGTPASADADLGAGWSWRGVSAVLVAVAASTGASPAEVEGGEDHRRLGAFVRVEPTSPPPPPSPERRP